MRLEPLYRVTFHYPEHWHAELAGPNGIESAHFFIADGRCEGRINGRFRGANHPRWLNDVVCALAGEVRADREPGATEIVLDVAELVWEEIP